MVTERGGERAGVGAGHGYRYRVRIDRDLGLWGGGLRNCLGTHSGVAHEISLGPAWFCYHSAVGVQQGMFGDSGLSGKLVSGLSGEVREPIA